MNKLYTQKIIGVIGLLLVDVVAADENYIPHLFQHEVKLGSCHFKFNDLYGRDLEDGHSKDINAALYLVNNFFGREIPIPLEISFKCYSSDDKKITSEASGFVLDIKTGKWTADYQKQAELGYDTPSKKMRFTMFNISSVNASGYAITQDDAIGDKGLQRSFSYCLFHPPVALCGISPAVIKLKDPKDNLLPYVLKILKSIEFIDTPTASQPSNEAP